LVVHAVIEVSRPLAEAFAYRVTEYVDGERLVLHGEGARATSLDTIVFEPTAAGALGGLRGRLDTPR